MSSPTLKSRNDASSDPHNQKEAHSLQRRLWLLTTGVFVFSSRHRDNLISAIISWWHGQRIGDVRYIKSLPYIVGNISHFAPTSCWTDAERSQLRLRAYRETWNGRRWVRESDLELTIAEWRELLSLKG